MVDVHKSREEKRGPYSAIFTKQSWLIKDLLHSKKDFSALRMKNDLFISRERKESQPYFFGSIKPRESLVSSRFSLLSVAAFSTHP